jgi:O-methyltransferase
MIRNNIARLKWMINNWRKIEPKAEYIAPWFGSQYPITYNTDGIATANNADFIKEPRFARAYEAAKATKPWEGFTLQWRTYIVCWFADLVKNLDGDFVECGVNTGAYSRAVIEYIDFKKLNKTFHLLDTFEGLVSSLVSEEEKAAGIDKYFNSYKDVYAQVQETFKDFNVHIIKGMVPDTLEQCKAEKICYLSIDMNCVAPEIAAAEFFWNNIVKGGVIILDDYGFPMHIHQKTAFDKFAAEKKVSILSLPTGQGIIFKGEDSF